MEVGVGGRVGSMEGIGNRGCEVKRVLEGYNSQIGLCWVTVCLGPSPWAPGVEFVGCRGVV